MTLSTHETRMADHETRRHGGAQTVWDGVCQECGWTTDPCLDDHTGETCQGAIEYRMALSGTGQSFPRCDKHWEERLDVQQGIDRRYPDSPFAPSDFDPADAGESWDDE